MMPQRCHGATLQNRISISPRCCKAVTHICHKYATPQSRKAVPLLCCGAALPPSIWLVMPHRRMTATPHYCISAKLFCCNASPVELDSPTCGQNGRCGVARVALRCEGSGSRDFALWHPSASLCGVLKVAGGDLLFNTHPLRPAVFGTKIDKH